MKFVLVHHPSDLRLVGTKHEAQGAHLLRTRGGILLPVGRGISHNTLHDWSRRDYGFDGQLPPQNHVLPGPVLYVTGCASSIAWAMMLDATMPGPLGGRVSVVPSSVQRGNGYSSVQPLGNTALTIDDAAIRIAAEPKDGERECVLLGQFDIAANQACFTAFDFYFSFPRNFSVRWVAVSQLER